MLKESGGVRRVRASILVDKLKDSSVDRVFLSVSASSWLWGIVSL